MDRTSLGIWLRAHRPVDAREQGWRNGILSLLAEVDDPFSRSTFEPGHVTASAFVLSPDGERVLLIRHRTLARWLQPGGHIEADDADLVAAARREVVEETGVTELVLAPGDPWLLDVDVHEIPANPRKGEPAHRHYDARVLFRASSWDLADTGEVDGARWVPLDEIGSLETDDSVRRAIARLQARRDRIAGEPPLHFPAADRNAGPILEVLRTIVAPSDTVLELGTGPGQHAAALAPALGVATWWTAELEDDGLISTAHRARLHEAVQAPVRVDLAMAPWRGLEGVVADVVYCANVIHIAPPEVTTGLLDGVARHLRPGGHFVLYGPFRVGGTIAAPSNQDFDDSLRSRDPRWGLRDLEAVVAEGARRGLAWQRTVPMPANNLSVVFRREDDQTGLVDPRASALLDRWFGGDPANPPQEARQAWFRKDPEADRWYAEHFGAALDEARAGALDGWARTPRGRLALVLLLDQLTRQVFRDTPAAFASDPHALRIALEGLARGEERRLTSHERAFLLMPLMHSEDRLVQDLSVAAFRDLADEHEAFSGNLDFAHRHRDIVVRFGRYPHRNAVLGRETTAEEAEFLKGPGSSF